MKSFFRTLENASLQFIQRAGDEITLPYAAALICGVGAGVAAVQGDYTVAAALGLIAGSAAKMAPAINSEHKSEQEPLDPSSRALGDRLAQTQKTSSDSDAFGPKP